jgi:hypothetical protein
MSYVIDVLEAITKFEHGEPLENHVNINHPSLSSLKAAVDRGAHKLSVKQVDDSYGQKRVTVEIGHHIPSHWQKHTKPYPLSSTEHYDPTVAHVDHHELSFQTAIRPN